MTDDVRKLRPIFTGHTEEDEEISIYQNPDKPGELHILLPNCELCPLGPVSEISTWFDPRTGEMRVDIVSDGWTGQAKGNKWELMRTDPQ